MEFQISRRYPGKFNYNNVFWINILYRNDGKKNDLEFCRRWEKQLAEKQKELDSTYIL